MAEARSQQAASMTEFLWLGHRFPISNAKTRVSILKGWLLSSTTNKSLVIWKQNYTLLCPISSSILQNGITTLREILSILLCSFILCCGEVIALLPTLDGLSPNVNTSYTNLFGNKH